MSRKSFFSTLKIGYGIEVLVWIIVFVLLTISNISFDLFLSIKLSILLLSGMVGLSIINRVILIPFFLRKDRLLLYFIFSIFVLIVMSYMFSTFENNFISDYFIDLKVSQEQTLLDIQLPSESKPFFDAIPVAETRMKIPSEWKITILFVGTFLVTILMFYMRRSEDIEQQQRALMQEKAEMELKFLRSQINPHFLFNALNNIYSLVYTEDKNAANSVLSLSEMLRYVTYESKENKILLKNEISYLENFINFQKYSYENPINIFFEMDIKEEDTIYISPMLFQPFLENSFKYSGIGLEKDAYIRISLKADSEELNFTLENSVRRKNKKEQSQKGIGILNVQRRLNLLYPEMHQLKIKEADNLYYVSLKINLKSNSNGSRTN